MAKKSAKSKGYRKQVTKKPYLSKRDIVVLCVLMVALAIGAFFLFRYDDGALKIKDGAVVAEGDNWLIVNGSNVRGRARYFKLGEVGEIDGYSREARTIATDVNVPEYAFTPEAEDAGIGLITVTTSHSAAKALADYGADTLASLDGNDVGEMQATEVGGRDVVYYVYTTEYTVDEGDDTAEGEAADEESDEAAPNRFTKSLAGYIDASQDSCVAIHVEASADSAEEYLSDAALAEALEWAVQAVTIE